MKTSRLKLTVALIMLVSLVSGVATAAATPELSEKMTQGQFAVWLVQAIGASSKLSAAPSEQQAIDFLTKLNIQPKDGWSKNTVLTKQFLASLLGDDSAANLDFKALVARLRDYVSNLFRDADQAIFRVFGSSSSGSVTI